MPQLQLSAGKRIISCPCLIEIALLAASILSIEDLQAEVEISTGDGATRHHLELLVDQSILSELVTTWPLNTSSLGRGLAVIEPSDLDPHLRNSYEFLIAQSIEEVDGLSTRLYTQAGNDREILRGFSSDSRESNETGVSIQTRWQNFKGQFDLSYSFDPVNGQKFRWDDSYLSVNLGEWTLGAGKRDRWWGPGWQSSLILSNNARPSPGLFLNRNTSQASELPILRKIGPWHLSLFANQLESNRHVSKAKLLGGRFTFKPHPALEVGLTRTAQWGGDGRPQDIDSLFKLILGQDNVGADGIELDGSNEPGNQLGGFDWRWSSQLAGHDLAVYGQFIGEDESGGFPSREIGLIGIEFPVTTASTSGRIFLEASDTSMRFLDDPLFNGAYNHHIYKSGYRYYGEPIGASTDNDSRLLALGGVHKHKDRFTIDWKTLYGTLNRDGIAANNSLAPGNINLGMVSIKLIKPVTENSTISLQAQHLTKPVSPSTDLSRNSLRIRYTIWQQ